MTFRGLLIFFCAFIVTGLLLISCAHAQTKGPDSFFIGKEPAYQYYGCFHVKEQARYSVCPDEFWRGVWPEAKGRNHG